MQQNRSYYVAATPHHQSTEQYQHPNGRNVCVCMFRAIDLFRFIVLYFCFVLFLPYEMGQEFVRHIFLLFLTR